MLNDSADMSSRFTVKAPFDAKSGGDCILRTPGHVQFKVSRYNLILASRVFKDMFDTPQPAKNQEPIPVIDVAESPETLEALLTMIYPIGIPEITDYQSAAALVTACDKYDMDLTRLKFILRGLNIFTSPDVLSKDGLSMYALAWKLGMEGEAKVASRYTHTINLHDPKVINELLELSGGMQAFIALLEMRKRREEALD